MKIWQWAGTGIAAFAVTVSLVNASWLAPRLSAPLILVAHRGVAQQIRHGGITDETCTAERMLPSDHDFIDNTLRSFTNARHFGAGAIALQVHPTRDGQMVAFHDWTVDCRTEGHGAVRDLTLAQLKKLDVGYGYTPDGGKTHPLRGKGVGGMPTVEEVLREVPQMRLIFQFKSKDPDDADTLLAALRRAGAKIDDRFGFYGDPRVISRVRQLAPGAWAFTVQDTKACLTDYVKFGWTTHIPASCRNTTVMVPLNYQWAIWGWPKRFLVRMQGAGTKVILTGDYEKKGALGLNRPEQLDKVPRDFRGYLWIEDFYNVGRALER
ncbi:MAG: glycerophosphoryl diester phosphodiesterase [Sphingomonadales bacterium]|jgi:glycerophosphoryl diester phosphodiesterase|nr:glycerophosphoryl diester phosphodiesterase [Sphingomonadales bacterium]